MDDQLDIKLSKKQIQAYKYLEDDITTEVLYGGAARGGKSWFGCLWQILRRITMPGSAGLIAREELTKLKDTTLLTFFKVSKAYGLTDHYTFQHGSLTATFKNGSVIFFREIKWLPADAEYDRLGSYDLTDCFLDESQQIRKKAVDVLKGRFSVLEGDTGNKDEQGNPIMWKTIPKALYTCNPRRNWIYSDFVLPAKMQTLPAFRKFIKALPSDNPHVPASYIENLMKADQVTVQRLVHGNFEYDDDPTKLVEHDAIMDLFTNDHVKPTGKKRLSADLAMQGRDRFIGGTWDGMVCTISLDKPKATGKSIEEDLKVEMIKSGISRSSTVVDSDGLGAYLDSYLVGIKTFHGGAKAFDDTEYANLRAECFYKLAEKINRREMKIICNDQQKQAIIEELGVLKSKSVDDDENRKRIIKKDEMKEALQRSPDYLDMLGMRMYFEVAPSNYNVYSL